MNQILNQNIVVQKLLFERLYQQGNTIILVTHEHDIAMHAHRVIFIRDGKIERDEKIKKD